MTGPTTDEYLQLSSDAYGLSTAYSNNQTYAPPPGMTVIAQSNKANPGNNYVSDGFAAVALKDANGNVVIVNEGTTVGTDAYSVGSLKSDTAISQGNANAMALVDARAFADYVESVVGATTPIYVTGHSLGGIEAQAEAQELTNIAATFAGGATFGSTGLPGQTAPGGPSTLVNNVDYGDPVGNDAEDTDTANPIAPAPAIYHYGQVEMVGNAANTTDIQKAQTNLDTALSVDQWAQQAGFGGQVADAYADAALVDLAAALKYHLLSNYASDLNQPAPPTPSPGGTPLVPVDWDVEEYMRIYGGNVDLAQIQDATVGGTGTVTTPSFTASYNASTNQITIVQTASVVAGGTTIPSGGVTTLTFSSSTQLPTSAVYTSPSGSTYTWTFGSTGNPLTLEVNESNSASYGITYQYNVDGSLTQVADAYAAINLSGALDFTQTTSVSNTGQISANITGSGDVVDVGSASLALASGAQAAVDAANDAITLAANVALTLGSGAAGNSVSVTGSGDTVNMSGAGGTLGSGTNVMVGSLEGVSFGSTLGVNVASGDLAVITGSDGVMTANNHAQGGVTQNLVNWNAGGSQTQNMSSGYTNTQELLSNFAGTNATGTLYSQTFDWTSGGSQEALYTGLGSGVSLQYNDYSLANDGGVLNNQIFNWNSGGSQEAIYTGLGAGVALQYNDYSGVDVTGTLNNQIFNWSAGGSQEAQFVGLGTGVALQYNDYSGANLTGTLDNNIFNWTSGGSQEAVYAGLPTGTSEVFDDYAGANLTGALNNQIFNWTGGGSQEALYTGLGTGISEQFDDFAGASASGTLNNEIYDKSAGGSFVELFTGLGSGIANEIETYSGANWTGNLESGTVNDTNGTSYDYLLSGSGDLSSGISERENFFSGANDTGLMNTADIDNANNTSIHISLSYNNEGQVVSSLDIFYSGSTDLGSGVFNGSGQFIEGYSGSTTFAEDDGTNGYDPSGGSGGYGGGYELTASGAKTSGTNIGAIASFDSQAFAPLEASAAEAAQQETQFLAQLQAAGSSLADMPFFEAGKWNSNVITWSLASSPGTTGSPFSAYMGAPYTALVQQAFNSWASASGLTFEQVADSSRSDIRLGWDNLNTTSSGVAGYTSYQYQNGQLQPDVIVELENPSQNALSGSGSNLTYSGTQVNLYSLLLHEIGHALGLADNGDPNSVMYYQASGNTTLDSNDLQGIRALYDGGPMPTALTAPPASTPTADQASLNTMLQQLAQASATFNADTGMTGGFIPSPQEIASSAQQGQMIASAHS